MFITLNYYDPKGKLYKMEETHYLHGKKNKYYSALYRNEDQLLEMYGNGKLTTKIDYDSVGTAVKETTVIGPEKNTLITTYIPKYQNGKLIERKIIRTNKQLNWNEESAEYYATTEFPDSTTVTITTGDENITTIEKKCYSKDKKLLYILNTTKAPAIPISYSFSFVNKYDEAGNKIEVLELTDNKVVSSERFYYTKGKLTSSIKKSDKITIKTVHE